MTLAFSDTATGCFRLPPLIRGGKSIHIQRITLDGAYAAGGWAVAASDFGLTYLDNLIPIGNPGGFAPHFDVANSKVKMFKAGAAAITYPLIDTLQIDADGAETNGGFISGLVSLTEQAAALAVADDGGVMALLSATAAAAGYTANYQLFPDTPADDDAVYFGAAAVFAEIAFNMSATACTYDAAGVLGWEYWDGSAWSTLTIVYDGTHATTHDGTLSFTRDGAISFAIPDDWASTTVNSQAGYWIRCVIQTGKAANMTQVGITDSKEHEVVVPIEVFTLPVGGTITSVEILDQAATLHAAADVKFRLWNVTQGVMSEELTFAQNKQQQLFNLTTALEWSEGDSISVVCTQEDGTNEVTNPIFTLHLDSGSAECVTNEAALNGEYLYVLVFGS